MSGGGRGGGTGVVGGETVSGGECKTIYRGAVLASPKREVVTKLAVGDILDLEAVQQGNTYVLYASHSGKRAGTVTHASLTEILRCIQAGKVYVGHIKKVEGGHVALDLRMKS
jgi:hypothetical protein